MLSLLRKIRGTPFDIFGRTAERRAERALIREYEETVEQLLAGLTRDNAALAVEIASLPEHIRGFGHIKMRSIEGARRKQAELRSRFGAAPVRAAA